MLFDDTADPPMNLLEPELVAEDVREPAAQQRIGAAMHCGLQTRNAELELARMLGS